MFSSHPDITVFNILQCQESSEGIEIDEYSRVNIHIKAITETNRSYDMVGVGRAAKTHLQALDEMIDESKVNLLVSCLGNDFSSAILPQISKISSEKGIHTIGLLTFPHPDEGFNQTHKAQHAIKNSVHKMDAYIQIPILNVYELLSGRVALQEITDKIAELITQVARAVVFGMIAKGFHLHRENEEFIDFFRNAGQILTSWKEIDYTPEDMYRSVLECIKEPVHRFEQFDRATHLMVSVCLGNCGLEIENYLKIGQCIRNEMGPETNILVKPYSSDIRGEYPFIVTFAKEFMRNRSERFDYPVTEDMGNHSPSQLSALYRKKHATSKGGTYHHDVSDF